MTRRYLQLSVLILVTACTIAVPRAIAGPDAITFINEIGVKTIQVLGPMAPAAQRLTRFRELLATDFDIPGIGQFVLGRYWRSATAEQQHEFLRLLREYLAQAYSARLADYAGERFQAIGARPSGEETIVASELTRDNGSKIRIDWYLVSQSGWKITDAYVAGISMKVTQRDEFASVIQQGGGQVEFLLGKLRQKIAPNQ